MSQPTMRLGDPFLIGVYCLAHLALGAAIGAKWAHTSHDKGHPAERPCGVKSEH